jgi:S-DNA-T family DNA segregation ATPase FtsK/SpoIIIE
VARKKNRKFKNKPEKRRRSLGRFALPEETKQIIFGVLMILAAAIAALSFFEKAGKAGEIFMKGGRFLIGESVFMVPLILFLAGLAFLNTKGGRSFLKGRREVFWPIILGVLILISGFSGILGTFSPHIKKGGWVGYVLSWPLLKYFGLLAGRIIFLALLVIGSLIIWQFLAFSKKESEKETGKEEAGEPPLKKPSIIKRIFRPKFKVKEIPQQEEIKIKQEEKEAVPLKLESKPIGGAKPFSYQPPPPKLLEAERGLPTSGDTKANSAIIKQTLHNFGIEVMMSEVNIGPTVTQYALKPAEGIKLSKITNLSNNLSLALASHPIRIEAPVPGRSLVGIEIPNKVRASVRLRNLIENSGFQKSQANLLIALGRDVSGVPIYADLVKMPHLLVAGSTGSGKTIFLNSLILSLLYQPSTFTKSAGPENLRFILVDPKRVEFPVYNNLPHLLCPVIYNAAETISALKWLTGEMERRFDVLAEVRARNIRSYNEIALKDKAEPLPFITLIIDELADLMAAKGREIEAGIVRLAQMSRAVGIHLVVATQRPSVEVITGLIKANITSRVTFKVASQIDSRTVLDSSGAEKLLGSGDMLYISSQTPKPKRIQSPYVSDKEVKNVVKYIISKNKEAGSLAEMDKGLSEELERSQENSEGGPTSFFNGEDSLYEEAKQLVIESKRASASLLQRRLRIGYARAARLIDMLEEKGVVGPADGAKPREVYSASPASSGTVSEAGSSGEGGDGENGESEKDSPENSEENGDEWKKI